MDPLIGEPGTPQSCRGWGWSFFYKLLTSPIPQTFIWIINYLKGQQKEIYFIWYRNNSIDIKTISFIIPTQKLISLPLIKHVSNGTKEYVIFKHEKIKSNFSLSFLLSVISATLSFEDYFLLKHQIELITLRQFKVKDKLNSSKDKKHTHILLRNLFWSDLE